MARCPRFSKSYTASTARKYVKASRHESKKEQASSGTLAQAAYYMRRAGVEYVGNITVRTFADTGGSVLE